MVYRAYRMDEALLRRLLSRFDPFAYERLVVNLFNQRPDEPFKPLLEADDHAFYQPLLDSHGDSLHRVFAIHYSPVELLSQFSPDLLADPELARRVARIWDVYKGRKGQWGLASPFLKSDRKLQTFAFLTNLLGFTKEAYEREIIPVYARIAKRLRLQPSRLFVGSYDSFLDLSLEETQSAFAKFVLDDTGELRITVSTDGPRVHRVVSERNLSAGVLAPTSEPLQPVFLLESDNSIIHEFEDLLRRGVTESQLERFLSSNYKLVFGPQYDRIETQLWLRFPELDVTRKRRRLDIFLRNSVTRDWDLRELKRSNIRLTGSARDVPTLARSVVAALYQVRNYARILAQDTVKRRLARDGIEYFEPDLGLVVGRAGEIPHEQWRWLAQSGGGVKITTYDELLNEARARAIDRASVIRLS